MLTLYTVSNRFLSIHALLICGLPIHILLIRTLPIHVLLIHVLFNHVILIYALVIRLLFSSQGRPIFAPPDYYSPSNPSDPASSCSAWGYLMPTFLSHQVNEEHTSQPREAYTSTSTALG